VSFFQDLNGRDCTVTKLLAVWLTAVCQLCWGFSTVPLLTLKPSACLKLWL